MEILNEKLVKKIKRKNAKGFMTITDDAIEYYIIVYETNKGIKYQLFFSNSEVWLENVRGTLAMTMIDNGNGYTFNGEQNFKNVDYSTGLYMRILLNLANKTTSYPYHVIGIEIDKIKDKLNL